MLERLEPEKWLEFNSKLQKKKSNLRAELSEKGVLKREGNNQYDKYKYFSEAQYKELFTELLPKHGIEINFNEVEYTQFDVEGKQPNGRLTKVEFYTYDVETGFYEVTAITGEGIDKGDKAGYKAYTGALKYFLADKFMVATGDDAERETPEGRQRRHNPVDDNPKVQAEHIKTMTDFAKEVGVSIDAICNRYDVAALQDMHMTQYVNVIRDLEATREGKEGVA